MTRKKAIMFDLDGTITNTLPLTLEGCRAALKEAAGLDIPYSDLKFLFGKTEEALFKKFCPECWEKGVAVYAAYFENHVTPAVMFKGMHKIFEYLKNKNVRMALVTGRGPQSAEVILQKAGIRDFFEYVKTGSPKGSIKTKCMKEVLADWAQNPWDTFYIGDVPQDVRDARLAGVKPLSCAWFEFADKKLLAAEKPLKVFDAVSEFFNFVKEEFN